MPKLENINSNAEFRQTLEELGKFKRAASDIEARIVALETAQYLRSAEGHASTADDDDTIERARRALAGQTADVSDISREIAGLRSQLSDLSPAISALAQRADRMRGDLSAAAARSLVKRQRASMYAILDAARALAAAVEAERSIRMEMFNGGYLAMEHILPPPGLAAGIMLGSEADFDSQISRYRRWLSEGGQ